MNGERAYKGAIKGFSAAFVGIGLALIVATVAAGGGPLAIGFLMGVAFVLVGAGRLWIATRMSREH